MMLRKKYHNELVELKGKRYKSHKTKDSITQKYPSRSKDCLGKKAIDQVKVPVIKPNYV